MEDSKKIIEHRHAHQQKAEDGQGVKPVNVTQSHDHEGHGHQAHGAHDGSHEGHEVAAMHHEAAPARKETSERAVHGRPMAEHEEHTADHGEHARAKHEAHADHTGHEEMFRRRFWVCLLLTIPVLLYSPHIQEWLGFSVPAFPGSQWIVPVFSVIIFAYGGVPFLQMAVPELRNRQPGMSSLVTKASLSPR